jgi:hypothetical protein
VDHANKRQRIEGPEEMSTARLAVAASRAIFPARLAFDAGIDDVWRRRPCLTLMDRSSPHHQSRSVPVRHLLSSRAESIAREIQFGEQGDHALGILTRASATRKASWSRTQSLASELGTPVKGGAASSIVESQGGGFSATTGMAMGLLRREIDAIEAADKAVSYDKVPPARRSVRRLHSSLSCWSSARATVYDWNRRRHLAPSKSVQRTVFGRGPSRSRPLKRLFMRA